MCFYTQVLVEMCPGLSVEKHVLSALDLRNHCAASYCFPPDQLMLALLSDDRLDARLYNPLAECYETLAELIAFNSNEVSSIPVFNTSTLHVRSAITILLVVTFVRPLLYFLLYRLCTKCNSLCINI